MPYYSHASMDTLLLVAGETWLEGDKGLQGVLGHLMMPTSSAECYMAYACSAMQLQLSW